MKTYPLLTPLCLILMILQACQTNEEMMLADNHVKTLLHQTRWQVVAMEATPVDAASTQDWYAALPDCVKDNIFFTQAPGSGTVGELQAEEATLLCAPSNISFHPHIAGWKLSDTRDIFSVDLFDTGHYMIYGYPLKASYHTENWHVQQLDDEVLQVRVHKQRDSTAYQVVIRFQSLPLQSQ